jgi:hypothetical protein
VTMDAPLAGTEMLKVKPLSQTAEFVYSHRETDIVMRVIGCVGRVFDAFGGPRTQDAVFWNLAMTKGVGHHEVADKPVRFMEGLQEIYGPGAAKAMESAIVDEIVAEFKLRPFATESDVPANQRRGREGFADVLARVRASASILAWV